jgi:hypothetical protein
MTASEDKWAGKMKSVHTAIISRRKNKSSALSTIVPAFEGPARQVATNTSLISLDLWRTRKLNPIKVSGRFAASSANISDSTRLDVKRVDVSSERLV